MAFRSYEDHIADILVAAGYRRFAPPGIAWDITIGRMNDSPDDQITVYQTGGLPSDVRWLLDYPSLQIKVRGGPNNYQQARQQAETVKNLLVGKFSYTASNGDQIVSISAIGDVGSTGWDDRKRPEFTVNIRLIAEPHPDNRPNSNRDPL